ncbi:unnamed protein product [Fraxinus pennsylvanica]|uniref:Uncharacterized protein n=1 Tax=Fraxinus pennsylvanica TaxID=56036 RepID=A0AAD2DRV9_9LAMI|nr:unnamed protein product [Fraxinus pennsylvanica]
MNPSTSLSTFNQKKGGFRTCTFVFVLGTLENIGFVANMLFMVLYFSMVMHFNISTAANTLTDFLGSTFLLTILGGFISDTYLNRLYTCLIFGFLEITGLLLVTIQAYSKRAGGVKGVIAALGADQFDHKDQKGAQGLASYFNYYQFSATIGSIIGVTAVVWVAMNKGWYWGFFIGLVTAFIEFVVLALGKPFYHFQPLANSPILRVSQVIITAIQNRNLSLPENPDKLYEIDEKERDLSEEKLSHTNQFRHSSTILNQLHFVIFS